MTRLVLLCFALGVIACISAAPEGRSSHYSHDDKRTFTYSKNGHGNEADGRRHGSEDGGRYDSRNGSGDKSGGRWHGSHVSSGGYSGRDSSSSNGRWSDDRGIERENNRDRGEWHKDGSSSGRWKGNNDRRNSQKFGGENHDYSKWERTGSHNSGRHNDHDREGGYRYRRE